MKNSVIKKSEEYARKISTQYKRVSGESYFDHAQGVVKALKSIGIKDDIILASAYLHHILLENPKKEEELRRLFGDEIFGILKKYKKVSDNPIREVKLTKANQKLVIPTYFNLVEDPKVLIIRLADKVDNIKTAHKLDHGLAFRVAEKALYIYSPICHLLGLSTFSKELENGALKILNPGEYYFISKYLETREEKINKIFEDATKVLKEILKENGVKAKIDQRIKNIYSIYAKLARRGNENIKMSDIKDIAAMRIIVDTVENCYKTENLLCQLWDNIPKLRDDYIAKPRISGYKSIHNIYIVDPALHMEVQIESKDMYEENEFGRASHAFYKIGEYLKENLEDNPDFLKEIHYKVGETSIKIPQFSNKIYVFTPLGDIIELPKGANLIDFAYEIHGDVGNSAVGGTINGHFQSLAHELHTGDRVDVQTSKSKKLSGSDWLKIAKTKKARDAIKKALKRLN